MLSLYVHFPFCKRKCFYCDFCSSAESAETVAAYCAALVCEIRRAGAAFGGWQANTVYLGGGTPSIVPAPLMAGVLDALRQSFAILPGTEFSTEANPGTLREDWLEAVRARGVNRLSLGMQATQDGLLRSLGRIHTHAETREAVRIARACGIRNLNLDLMYALPGQTARDYLDSVEAACVLAPEHISAYSLILEEGTPLCEAVRRGEVPPPDDDAAADMSAEGADLLAQRGYERYEISNYAKPGFACGHNLGYWRGAWYLGLGLGAHSLLPAAGNEAGARYARQANTDDLREYIRQNGDAVAERQPIGADEAAFESVMLETRTLAGVDERTFQARHDVSLGERYGAACRSLVADGLAEWSGGRFRLTVRGLAVQNAALMRFME